MWGGTMKWQRPLVPSYAKVLRNRVRRRLPRRLLRNLGIFYLILAGLAGLLVVGNTRPGFYQDVWRQMEYGYYWVRIKAAGVLPVLAYSLPLTGDLSRSILAEGLPTAPGMANTPGSHISPETLRSIVQVVTDYDLAEPESLIAAAFPGSRSTSGALRWDWIIQRGIEGYSLGSGALDAWQETVLGDEDNTSPQAQVEVVINAPTYTALATSTGDGSLEDVAAPMVTYSADSSVSESWQMQPAPNPTSLASRLESLSRVNWGNSPLVAVYHTHTGETYRDAATSSTKSYAWDVGSPGVGPVPGVVQVGDRLTRELQRRYGIPVIHSSKVHDYPVFAYAYSNSEKTAQMLVERYSSLQLVLDIHRDEGTTVETVQGRQLAGVLIIVASGGGSLNHRNWRQNLERAQLLKETFDRLYPGLCRGLIIKERTRYNQHVHPGALLLEIGAHSDTLDSALLTAELVADVVAETLWQVQSGSRGPSNLRTPTPLRAPSSPMEIFEPKNQRGGFGF
jgi:stage II sporulation protein P